MSTRSVLHHCGVLCPMNLKRYVLCAFWTFRQGSLFQSVEPLPNVLCVLRVARFVPDAVPSAVFPLYVFFASCRGKKSTRRRRGEKKKHTEKKQDKRKHKVVKEDKREERKGEANSKKKKTAKKEKERTRQEGPKGELEDDRGGGR